MSLYQLQKLIYHVNRDAERRERYRQDAAAFVNGYELSDEEAKAILNGVPRPKGRGFCQNNQPTRPHLPPHLKGAPPQEAGLTRNLLTNDLSSLIAYSHDEINADAGSGGHEIRTWIALAGAVQSWKAELLASELL